MDKIDRLVFHIPQEISSVIANEIAPMMTSIFFASRFLQLFFILMNSEISLGNFSTRHALSFVSRKSSIQLILRQKRMNGPHLSNNKVSPAFFKKSSIASFSKERELIFLVRGGSDSPSNNMRNPSSDDDSNKSTSSTIDHDSISRHQKLVYRSVNAQDIPCCYDIERSSYPSDEAASQEALEYRQSNANPYFRCAVIVQNDDETHGEDNEDEQGEKIVKGVVEEIIGFVCSTRCNSFEDESMSTHNPSGKLLAIHSVVIKEEFRNKGMATAMLNDYITAIKKLHSAGIEKIVLIAKSHLLGFYVKCGFAVTKLSPIVHGKDQWYELEMDITGSSLSKGKHRNYGEDALVRSLPFEDESWFVKTEQFCKPFPVVKPYLEEHRAWVNDLRASGNCITSGYRVDSEGKPGGGGMMFLAAKNYTDALKIVQQDPLVANGCVKWELNGWISEVGDVQLR